MQMTWKSTQLAVGYEPGQKLVAPPYWYFFHHSQCLCGPVYFYIKILSFLRHLEHFNKISIIYDIYARKTTQNSPAKHLSVFQYSLLVGEGLWYLDCPHVQWFRVRSTYYSIHRPTCMLLVLFTWFQSLCLQNFSEGFPVTSLVPLYDFLHWINK